MLPVMLTHVNDLMMYRFELELCIKIITDIVNLLFETNRLVCHLLMLIKRLNEWKNNMEKERHESKYE